MLRIARPTIVVPCLLIVIALLAACADRATQAPEPPQVEATAVTAPTSIPTADVGAPVTPALSPTTLEATPPPVRSLTASPTPPPKDRTTLVVVGGAGPTPLPKTIPVSATGDGSWVPLRLTKASSATRVTALAISPTFDRDRTLFAGTSHGVFRSSDGGETWTQKNQGLRDTGIRALAISPIFERDRTLFACVEPGLFRSLDAGDTWQSVHEWGCGSGFSGEGTALALSPAFETDSTLFAGNFRSSDGGETWQRLLISAQALAFSPEYDRDNTLFVGLGDRVFRSTDGGDTWEQVHAASFSSTLVEALAVSPAFDKDNTLFAGTSEGVYRSTDGGDTWQPVNEGLANLRMVQALAVSPAFAKDNTLFAGTVDRGVFRSDDRGESWERVGQGLKKTNVTTLAISPGFEEDKTLFAASRTGVFRGVDLQREVNIMAVSAPPPSNIPPSFELSNGRDVMISYAEVIESHPRQLDCTVICFQTFPLGGYQFVSLFIAFMDPPKGTDADPNSPLLVMVQRELDQARLGDDSEELVLIASGWRIMDGVPAIELVFSMSNDLTVFSLVWGDADPVHVDLSSPAFAGPTPDFSRMRVELIERAKATAPKIIGTRSPASLALRGDVIGLANRGKTAIDTVRFTLTSVAQTSGAVDLSTTAMRVIYLDPDQVVLCENPQDFDSDADTAECSWSTKWIIGRGDMLDPGEQVELTVTMTNLSPLLTKNKEFSIQVNPGKAAAVNINRTTPPALKSVMVLRLDLPPASTATPTPAPRRIVAPTKAPAPGPSPTPTPADTSVCPAPSVASSDYGPGLFDGSRLYDPGRYTGTLGCNLNGHSYSFKTFRTGVVTLRVTSNKKLALILNGPGRDVSADGAFARLDQVSPQLTFAVTEEVLSRGNTWDISVVNFYFRSGAPSDTLIEYIIEIDYPR